jgi:transcriptional regulator with XRE-family HTH domain
MPAANNRSKLIKNMSKKIDFPGWLEEQLNARGWGQADLANRAGINRQVIWGWLNRRKKPTEEYLVKIANAFDIPPAEMLRIAGVLPTESNHDAITEAVLHIIGSLDNSAKVDLLEYAKYLKGRNPRKGKNNT